MERCHALQSVMLCILSPIMQGFMQIRQYLYHVYDVKVKLVDHLFVDEPRPLQYITSISISWALSSALGSARIGICEEPEAGNFMGFADEFTAK